ncbi:DUF4314 domain-containing protein [Actinoplanes subtropicus]|uniref:DUF4314 domain-containing protein n=1 Tax=Actinoplanes subtropicus TaxID=543632 RepID=UPI0007C5D86F|nr:DUF4314 domain-containing protein [Actinoplanes subtropicus]
MTYRSGQRIVLVHTDDPFTDLRPGDKGTVTAFDAHQQMVAVSWDSGSELSMCLDAGDRIRVLAEPAEPGPVASSTSDPSTNGAEHGRLHWGQVLHALRLTGAEAGHSAADWWAQDSVGGRAGGDTAVTARKILTGIDDGDPAVLDVLPTVARSAADGEPDFYTTTVDSGPRWHELTAAEQQEALDAYHDSADTAVHDRITEHCRAAASPDPSGPEPEPARPAPATPRAGRP